MRGIRLIALSLLAAFSCGAPSGARRERSNLLSTLITEARPGITPNDLRLVVVLSERGCLPCTKAFADLMENHIEDPSVLFWVTAIGQRLDIGPYQSSLKQVIWDPDERIRSAGLLDGSGAILLKSGTIDTIIQLQARNLEGSLGYIAKKLKVNPDLPH
jgi:hypothetical protein